MLAGVGLGLFLARYVLPVSYSEAQPFDLNPLDKDEYIRMIAASYLLDNDYALANQRLYYLQLPDVKTRLTELAQAEPQPLTQQALVKLRLAMNNPGVALKGVTSTPRPTRDLTPAPRVTIVVLEPTVVVPTAVPPTPQPTSIPATSEPNPDAPRFDLIDKRALDCATVGGGAAIQVEVQDVNGQGLAGVAVEVNSDRGSELFYTGFKPERGIGYGDVSLNPGVFSAHLVENARSDVIGDLRIDANVVECSSTPSATQGWHLVFRKQATP